MDCDNHAVGDSTALVSSHQTVQARGSSGVAFWNELSAYRATYSVYVLFEADRRSANYQMNKYFNYLERLPTSITELNENGMCQELSTRDGLEARRNMWRLKIAQDTAVEDLKNLIENLDKIKEQEKSEKRTNSPAALIAWTVACSILAFAVPHEVSSSAFKIGGLGGMLLFAVRLLWKPSSLESLDPVQHKLEGLLQSFQDGTMQYRDRNEVLIAKLNRKGF
ncbi:hypothetical protein FPOAC2_10053 [Fusarium poae]